MDHNCSDSEQKEQGETKLFYMIKVASMPMQEPDKQVFTNWPLLQTLQTARCAINIPVILILSSLLTSCVLLEM